MPDNDQILSSLLEIKLQTLNVYATTGMTWWVSSVVFCGTIIGAAWIKRLELEKFPLFGLLGWLLTIFFSSIVLFGAWVIYAIHRVQIEVEAILSELSISSELGSHFTFLAYQVSFGIGTTSFAIILVLWVLLWKYISNEKRISDL